MTGTGWLVLWGVILAISLLIWALILRRTYLSFRNLQSQLKFLMDAVSSAMVGKQTRLSQNLPAVNEEER
ncbi:hypothetical protein GALL_395510 [mine drainage metagenome]|uniref:Uncharacterized protein n=1 Tax=mine drainage metagenome TaxID=410659 RepID=A0A1J5Q4T4_9ZZZZ